jgi:predicted RNase H-like HicB family nuclease
MNRRYAVVFEPEKEGGFSASVPDLLGCASQAETYDEALANIREALTVHLEGLRLDGRPAPEARAQIVTVDVEAARAIYHRPDCPPMGREGQGNVGSAAPLPTI